VQERAIDASRHAMLIAKMSMETNIGDIDKTGRLVEEPVTLEKSAQLTPEATYYRNLNDLAFVM